MLDSRAKELFASFLRRAALVLGTLSAASLASLLAALRLTSPGSESEELLSLELLLFFFSLSAFFLGVLASLAGRGGAC